MSIFTNLLEKLRLVRRLPARPRPAVLELRLGSRVLRFASPREFEFGCAGRTSVPAAKFGDMLSQSAADLEQEARGIRELERRFVLVLEKCLADVTSLSGQLRDLGAKIFSKDHGWRDLMAQLMVLGPAHDEYKKIALVKYMQYLAARQDLASIIYSARTSRALGNEDAPPAPEPQPIGTRETVIFDLMQIQDTHRLVNPFERLPRGETVEVHVPRGEGVEILLSKHRFRLVVDGDVKLIDESGHEYRIPPGRHSVGRHTGNDIPIDNALRSVSRKHLIVEPDPDGAVRLTDVSAHGTFVPPQYVVHTVH